MRVTSEHVRMRIWGFLQALQESVNSGRDG